MAKKPTQEELEEAAADLNDLFDPPLKNDTATILKAELIEAGKELQEDDNVSDETKATLRLLGVELPWPEEETEKEPKEVKKKPGRKPKAKAKKVEEKPVEEEVETPQEKVEEQEEELQTGEAEEKIEEPLAEEAKEQAKPQVEEVKAEEKLVSKPVKEKEEIRKKEPVRSRSRSKRLSATGVRPITRAQAFCKAVVGKPKTLDEIGARILEIYKERGMLNIKDPGLDSVVWASTVYIGPMVILGFVEYNKEDDTYVIAT